MTDLGTYGLVTEPPSPGLMEALQAGLEQAADFCKVQPAACKNNLGIPRDKMPQIQRAKTQEFLDSLKDQGIKVTQGKARVGDLRATQREINSRKVAEMIDATKAGKFDPAKAPVIVSNDRHILDGHHRWAALIVIDPSSLIPVRRVDLTMRELLERAHNFGGVKYRTFEASAQLDKRTIQRTLKAVRSALTNELRSARYRDNPNPMAGHCYVASEALYHLLGGRDAGWKPMQVEHEGEPHWFLKNESLGLILDPTSDQFKTPVPVANARGKGFLTAQPSKRAQLVIDRAQKKLGVQEATAGAETGPFKVGDEILYGKYKNKRGKIVSFGKNPKGQVTVEVEPIPKGRKQNKLMGLYKIWTVETAVIAEMLRAGRPDLANAVARYW